VPTFRFIGDERRIFGEFSLEASPGDVREFDENPDGHFWAAVDDDTAPAPPGPAEVVPPDQPAPDAVAAAEAPADAPDVAPDAVSDVPVPDEELTDAPAE